MRGLERLLGRRRRPDPPEAERGSVGLGREGEGKGARGETIGEPWRRWGGVPRWCPPARK